MPARPKELRITLNMRYRDFDNRDDGRAFAMVDCNNFYASCERVFDPTLINKPVVILSNNDGCVIARSSEAKDLNIPMGAPEFKYRRFFKENNVSVLSSNYTLYGDMSNRVIEALSSLTPATEVYSIDEAFAELSQNTCSGLKDYGLEIRRRIYRWTGIPVSVGIAPSKTLAKIANHRAKQDASLCGVLDLSNKPADYLDTMLSELPVRKIWGIGPGLTQRLAHHGIHTALELKNTIHNQKWVKKHLKVTGLRTVLELNGYPCQKLSNSIDPRKGIVSSRMFGKPLYDAEPIEEALASYISRAAEKLRAQDSVASNMQITLVGDKYANLKAAYKYRASHHFREPTANTPEMIRTGIKLLRSVYIKGNKYKKAAVMLTGIVPQSEVQMSLFEPGEYSRKQYQLMETLDRINAAYGKQTASFAAAGLHTRDNSGIEWQMKQEHLSQRYTTRWDELMTAGTN